METCDDEFVAAATDFIQRQHDADTPFFVWFNTTHMHLFTHPKPESVGQAGRWQSPYHDTMIDHDKHVGQMLDLLDELGIADNTFVMYSTDNGPHMNTLAGRRHDAVPQREEHQLGRRLPGADAGPLAGQDRSRHRSPTASSSTTTGCRPSWPRPVSRTSPTSCKTGYQADGKTFKVHIDGYNLLPYLTGEAEESPRKGFFYFSDDGDVVALRFDNWKLVFMEQRVAGTLQVWAEPFVPLRVPKLFNLRTDPYERADITSNTYYDWFLEQAYFIDVASCGVTFTRDLQEFPPREAGQLHHRPAMAEDAELASGGLTRADGEACDTPVPGAERTP